MPQPAVVLKDLPVGDVAVPAVFGRESFVRDGVAAWAHVQGLAVGAVVGCLGRGRVGADVSAVQPVAHIGGGVGRAQRPSIGTEPSLDVLRVDGEVQQQVFDLHHVAHRVQRDGEVSRQCCLDRGFEVGDAAVDEKADLLQRTVGGECRAQFVEVRQQLVQPAEACAVGKRLDALDPQFCRTCKRGVEPRKLRDLRGGTARRHWVSGIGGVDIERVQEVTQHDAEVLEAVRVVERRHVRQTNGVKIAQHLPGLVQGVALRRSESGCVVVHLPSAQERVRVATRSRTWVCRACLISAWTSA